MAKYAIVSGTDHGLGRELAKELSTRGYSVLAGRYDMSDVING